MEEKTKKDDELQPGVTEPETEIKPDPVEDPKPAADVTDDPEAPAVDDKGVPYKNRAAMYQRQLEDVQREIDLLKSERIAAQPKVDPRPKIDPKKDMDEFIDCGPTAYYEKRKAEERHEAQIVEAERLILERTNNDPIAAKLLIPKIHQTAQDGVIDLKGNPVAGVKAVFKVWDRIEKESDNAKKAESKAAEKQRIDGIQKTKTNGGNKPPAPPVEKTVESLRKLRERGSDEDGINYLKDMFE